MNWAGSASSFDLAPASQRLAYLKVSEGDEVFEAPAADLTAHASVPAHTGPGTAKETSGAPETMQGPADPALADDGNVLTSRVTMKQRGWTKGLTRLEIAYQVANALDLATTLYCLDKNSCHEANPIFGRNPGVATLVAGKAASGALHYIIVSKIAKKDTKAAKIFSSVTLALQSGVVGMNLTHAF